MRNIQSTSLSLQDGILKILDQQKLPDVEEWLTCNTPDDSILAIKQLKVRGAPLIGVFASLSLALFSKENREKNAILLEEKKLRDSRPTAVNLMNALDRMLDTDLSYDQLMKTALEIYDEDIHLCDVMGQTGSTLIHDGDNILTHCNAGSLATVGKGTALAVIHAAHKQGKKIHVYVDETRPLLQGGRLTAWELKNWGIPHTIICDNMAASLMAAGKIQKVFLGADRIAINGDFANKIGTYSVAVLAHYHNVPFYPVAPSTTIDKSCMNGDQIPIELRDPAEVKGVSGSFGSIRWSPVESDVYNPAFDVTPFKLVTKMIIDDQIFDQSDVNRGVLKNL